MHYEATTVGSSMTKLPQSLETQPKIKHYYLSQLAAALQGNNKRALEHLSVSHKILKNYHKIESPTFGDIEEKKVNLSRSKGDIGKKTLLIDIDETILHCDEEEGKPYDVRVPVMI